MSWRQKFLQRGMEGTSIVFGNGDASTAMAEFPPNPEVLQDSFVAVFTGPENPTPTEQSAMQGASAEDLRAQRRMAAEALRKEVELWVDKDEFDQQARRLLATNYVYNESAHYRRDLVEGMPAGKHLPAAFEAAATFVPTDSSIDDDTQAPGPGSSTNAGQQELQAQEQQGTDNVKWMSVLDESMEDTLEMSRLPAMQGMLERMEQQAGRVVANELHARCEEAEEGARDDVGRQRLQTLCKDFHQHCTGVSREQELLNLQWRIQAMAENKGIPSDGDVADTSAVPADASTNAHGGRPAQLRVPTTRVAQSWWNPRYWPVARPTDFSYGDCVWGLEHQPVPLSIGDWCALLWRREEMEYSLPDDAEQFVARPINRFRESWYVLHTVTSFWTRAETTRSIHTFLKTPGAFGFTRGVADLTPEMLAEAMFRSEESGRKPSLQSLLSDKDIPAQLRKALMALHQSTANVLGSNGHRRLLQREGVAYTLAYGAPLVFTTVNPADTKQPLLLVVQGEYIRIEEPLPSFREMTERLASDPAGQALVFEFLIRSFFVCVLGVREECVGWRRGSTKAVRTSWCTDGVAHEAMGSTLFGWVQAAFGPIEAQGRGSLHPHILLWLLDLTLEEAVEFLSRDRQAFQANVARWMAQVADAVHATQETAVTELPRTWACEGVAVPPLPLGPKDQCKCRADGQPELTTASDVDTCGVEAAGAKLYFTVPGATAAEDEWPEAVRANLVLRSYDGQEVDAATWTQGFEEMQRSLWTQSISDTASGKRPAYCSQHEFLTAHELDAPAVEHLREAMPSEDFLRHVCFDARDLVIGCAVHVCSPSCWKYHSSGKSQICRHGFYHVVVFVDEHGLEVKRRRQGKQLRGCMAIFRDTRYGMAGRFVTFQAHPFECPTNYVALVALRCNVDVQDHSARARPGLRTRVAESRARTCSTVRAHRCAESGACVRTRTVMHVSLVCVLCLLCLMYPFRTCGVCRPPAFGCIRQPLSQRPHRMTPLVATAHTLSATTTSLWVRRTHGAGCNTSRRPLQSGRRARCSWIGTLSSHSSALCPARRGKSSAQTMKWLLLFRPTA